MGIYNMKKEEAVALLERYSNYDGMGIPNLAGCKEAMRVAVDALKDLGWHAVDEFLPPMDEEVIVLTDEFGNAPVYEIAVGHTVDKNKVTDFDGWNIPGVRFWMPMPEIPKEGKK